MFAKPHHTTTELGGNKLSTVEMVTTSHLANVSFWLAVKIGAGIGLGIVVSESVCIVLGGVLKHISGLFL